MEKPTVTIDGVAHEIRNLKVRDWRFFAEFMDADIKPSQPEFIEKHAGFIASFFDGVTTKDILDLPLEDIMPLFHDIVNYIMSRLLLKFEDKKNVETADAEKA